jgi:DNA-binding GntR family transcriptional regulator
MNSGATAERVYDAVKRRILTGAYQPGQRIEVAALAEALDSSNTPVRDALHLLVGERLVETRAGDGFHLPQLDAAILRDLYRWNAQVLLQALRGSAGHRPHMSNRGKPDADDPAEAIGSLFARIAHRAGNVEFVREVRAINDRLHAVRIAGSGVIRDWKEEIATFDAELERDNLPAIRRLIVSYHRRREHLVLEILRALHELDDAS